jgi:hypothetical protein
LPNWLFGLPGRKKVFVNSPLGIKKRLCSSPVSSFRSLWVWTSPIEHPCTAHAFFPDRLSDLCQGLRRTFSEICTNLIHTGYWTHRGVASHQIHDSK